jgi:hypothetical protein
MPPQATPISRDAIETDDRLHAQLAAFNRTRLAPRLPHSEHQRMQLLQLERAATLVERIFVERERALIARRAATAPTEPEAFVRWFEALREHGPGQGDPLFPWLAERASLEQMRWFLQQEAAGEAGFDDLVALTQVKLGVRPKLEMARNYWDEMGCGHAGGMHGPLLQTLCDHLDLSVESDAVWQSRALSNLMVALACNRDYAYHSVGALGVIELTAPGRAKLVNAGLQRLGVPGQARRYFALHATLDVKHSAAWNAEVLAPLVAELPECAHAIAEGALMRLRAGERCFERYRHELGIVVT